jgi:hypothetical protein
MAQAFTADTRERDFDAALVADYTAMLHALILAAQAFPILGGAKNSRAEQPVALRLKRSVIDGLRLGNFAVGPAPDLFRRSQRNADRIKIRNQIRSIVRRGSQNCLLFFKNRKTVSATNEHEYTRIRKTKLCCFIRVHLCSFVAFFL